MDVQKYLLLMHYCLFKLTWANLKRCSENHDKLAICLNKGNSDIFQVTVDTFVYLKEIIKIDENENSIRIDVKLWTQWTDPGLSLSNNSAE